MLYSGAVVGDGYGKVSDCRVLQLAGLGLDQVPTSLALLPSQAVGSAHFLLLGSGGLCATCVVHNEQHATASSSTAAPASTGGCFGDSLQQRYVS